MTTDEWVMALIVTGFVLFLGGVNVYFEATGRTPKEDTWLEPLTLFWALAALFCVLAWMSGNY